MNPVEVRDIVTVIDGAVVIDRGEWMHLGRLYNVVVMPDGSQTSIIVTRFDSLEKKVREVLKKFKCAEKD